MAKKPGLIARIDAVQAALKAGTYDSPAEQTDIKERIGISIRMDGDTHDELRRISYETRTSIQKLVMQGIKGVISKHPAK